MYFRDKEELNLSPLTPWTKEELKVIRIPETLSTLQRTNKEQLVETWHSNNRTHTKHFSLPSFRNIAFLPTTNHSGETDFHFTIIVGGIFSLFY
jgi:hypothetical protein